MGTEVIICADVIAHYGDKFVLVERLGRVKGLSLPGGKQNPGEMLSATAIREFAEETGLILILGGVLGTYTEPGRDPRGNYVSTVFTGVACGKPCNEEGKTRVLILERNYLLTLKYRFVFDHFSIIEQYLSLDK